MSLLRGKNNVECQRYERALPPRCLRYSWLLAVENRGVSLLLSTQGLCAGPDLQLGLAYNGYLIIAVDAACSGLNTWLPLPPEH